MRSFLIFAGIYIVFSLLTYKHYGISWDEPLEYHYSRKQFRYMFLENLQTNPLKSWVDERYLVSFQDYMRPSNINIKSYGRLYLMPYTLLFYPKYDRIHLFFMLSGLLIFFLFFKLMLEYTKSPSFSLLSCIFLMLTPRFIGHLPFNPKDIPFAIVFFLGLFIIYISQRRGLLFKVFALGIVFGVSLGMRPQGVILILTYIIYETLTSRRFKEVFKVLMLSFPIMGFVIILFNPYIGSNFFLHLLEYFQIAKKYPWGGNIIFFGKIIKPMIEIPRIYLISMITITTPVFILLLFLLSVFFLKKHRLYILMWIPVILTVIISIVFKPATYDGIRHYMFIVPPIVFLSSMTFFELMRGLKNKYLKYGITVFTLAFALKTAYDMLKIYPYHYAYFNEFVGGFKNTYRKFDQEYWCLSYKESAEYIDKLKEERIKLFMCNCPGITFTYFSKKAKEGKIQFVRNYENADYITCFPRHWTAKGEIEVDLDEFQNFQLIHKIEREGVPLNFILKRKKTPQN